MPTPFRVGASMFIIEGTASYLNSNQEKREFGFDTDDEELWYKGEDNVVRKFKEHPDHNLLTNLQGGDVNQYYHVTDSEHDLLTTGIIADDMHHHSGLYSRSGNTLCAQIYEYSDDLSLMFNKIISLGDPLSDQDAATKAYVDRLVQGLAWGAPVIDFYNPTGGLPPGPSTGDRYIASATANGWTINNIYEFSSGWVEVVASEGDAVWVTNLDEDYTFNGSAWVKFGSTITHKNLSGLQGGTTDEYYHLTADEHTGLHEGTSAHLTRFTATGVLGNSIVTELSNGIMVNINSGQSYVSLGDNNYEKIWLAKEATSFDFAIYTSDVGKVLTITQADGHMGLGITPRGKFEIYQVQSGIAVYMELSIENLAHGMTGILPTNVFGGIHCLVVDGADETGGLQIIGIAPAGSENDISGIQLDGYTGTSAAAICLNGHATSGTGGAALSGQMLLDVKNHSTSVFEIDADGSLLVTGGLTMPMTATKTDNYTADSSDFTMLLDDASLAADKTLALPSANGCSGKIFVIHVKHTNVSYHFILNPDGTETIEGNSTWDLVNGSNFTMIVQSNGDSDWKVIGLSIVTVNP